MRPEPDQSDIRGQSAELLSQIAVRLHDARLLLECVQQLQRGRADGSSSPLCTHDGVPETVSASEPGHRIVEIAAPISQNMEMRPASADRHSCQGVLDQFALFRETFSQRQWEAVCLYYGEGLSDAQVGERLGISERAAYDRRRRAEARKSAREKQLREERFCLTRKYADF